jgi:hypothetical protein
MHDGIRKRTQMYVYTALTLVATSAGDIRRFVRSLQFRKFEMENWNRSSNTEVCVMICPMIFLILAVLPSSTYLLTAGVEVVYFRLITLKHTRQ